MQLKIIVLSHKRTKIAAFYILWNFAHRQFIMFKLIMLKKMPYIYYFKILQNIKLHLETLQQPINKS